MPTKISEISAELTAPLDGDELLAVTDDPSGTPATNKVTASTLQNAIIVTETGTTRTLSAADGGKHIRYTNASGCTVTLPNNLAVGIRTVHEQAGAGQVTLSAGSGATLSHRQSHTKTAGQHASMTTTVTTNSGGSSATYNLIGDTSA